MTEPEAAPQRFGRWRVVGFADTRTAKRALCKCDCGAIREVSYEALTTGLSIACSSCFPPRNLSDPSSRTFASDLAASETRGARKRQFGQGEDG
jgi:hypothetical protein